MDASESAGAQSLRTAPRGHGTACNDAQLPRPLLAASWLLQFITAGILLQTLFFKFTAAPESVYIFTTLGIEPWGRIGSGVAELIACALLLAPQTVVFGALLSLGVISGAIVSHLTKLGIAVNNDGGLLFGLALVVFVCSGAILLIRRANVMMMLDKLRRRPPDAPRQPA